MKHAFLLTFALAGFLAAGCSPNPADSSPDANPAPAPLTIYSARHYDSDRALYAAYEASTGIKVEVREASADQLLESLKAEGRNSPADLIIASDAGALWRFQNAGLTQPLDDAGINASVPSNYREGQGNWIGVARRVRLVAYDPTRFTPEDVGTWASLADPAKRGEICVRSSSNVYNLSLMAEMIARVGPDEASAWATGIAANLARQPQGGDTDQIRAVAAGECGVAIVNHYYWVRLATSTVEADRQAAAATRLIVPTFTDNAGAHVNITGISIAASADDPSAAAGFIRFLLTPEGQNLLVTETKELPLLDSVPLPAGVELVPPFTPSDTPLSTFGENQAEAQRRFDLAGWN